MRAELRPSSLGEILDRTAQMYRRHFLLYFGIAAVSYAGVLVLSLIANVLILHQVLPQHGSTTKQAAGIGIAVGGGVALLYFLPIAIAMAAIIRAVAANYLGQTTTIAQAYRAIGRRWYRYILILLAMYLYAMGPALLAIGVTAIPIAIMPSSFGRNLFIGSMVMLVLVGFCVALWWMLRWALAVPASLMEDLPVHRSLKRSASLTKGAWGRIFVMMLLVGAVMAVIQYAVQIPMFFMLFRNKGAITLATQVVASCGTFLSGAFVLPVYSIALTLFYYDQRIRKEGYDVEWLMQQAGAAVDPSALTQSPGPTDAHRSSPNPAAPDATF